MGVLKQLKGWLFNAFSRSCKEGAAIYIVECKDV